MPEKKHLITMPGYTFKVHATEASERIDSFLAGKTGISRSQIQKYIEEGNVLVCGKSVRRNYRVRADDDITMTITEKETGGLTVEPIPLDIFYKDPHLVVVNKPPGMVVYPAAGHAGGTLMNALAYHCEHLAATGGPLRPGVVHRLDKDTSGVMVIALDDAAYYKLAEQFSSRTINRKYLAFVYGQIKSDSGSIEASIGRSESDRKKMSTRSRRGKEAVTTWKVIERFGGEATLIEAKLGTGRTHQIRVHFASVGHPVLGDRTYGKKTEVEIGAKGRGKTRIVFPRQMLHARLLGFIHPITGEYLEFSSPPPEDMAEKIEELRAALLDGRNSG
ncbi:MAG: RluA family pseudouridine synthase [Nitrospirota bacterium]